MGKFNILLFGAVMKRTALALSFVLLLSISVVVGMQFVEVARANPAIEINTIIQIDSPKNITYTTENIPLNVVVTGDATKRNYTVAYRIIFLNPFSPYDTIILGNYFDDGTPDVYNSTLSLKQDGQYALRVSVSFSMVGVYDKIFFTGQANPPTPSPTPSASLSPQQSNSTELKPVPPTEPFPTLLIVATSVATVAVVTVGVLVYFKKRKHKAEITNR